MFIINFLMYKLPLHKILQFSVVRTVFHIMAVFIETFTIYFFQLAHVTIILAEIFEVNFGLYFLTQNY